MKEYKTNDINRLIEKLLMACMEHPISVYIDRKEAMVITSETEREGRWMWKNRDYTHVLDIDRNASVSVIRNNILDKLEEVGRDYPIPTSMQRLTIGDEK
ncbi:MAG: hypothetical protein ABUJ92_00300 [Desulfobacterales bacterium]